MAVISMSEVKVGVAVILASALLIALTIAVGNFESYFKDTITISIVVPSVVGLEPYAMVTYDGVRIGSVSDIYNDAQGDMVIIRAEIEMDSPVALDSEARFTAASLLSPLFIDITGGTPEKRIYTLLIEDKLNPDDVLIEATPYMSIGDVFALAADVKSILNKVEGILDEIYDPLSKFGGFVSNVSGEISVILADIRSITSESRPRVQEFLETSSGLISSASDRISATLRNIEESSEALPKFSPKPKRE
jgi:ABC-type transporter Mla subunit MlaD